MSTALFSELFDTLTDFFNLFRKEIGIDFGGGRSFFDASPFFLLVSNSFGLI